MSREQPIICAIGLTPATLSQWRDQALDVKTTRTIEQHVGTCDACQIWLQSFAATAQHLRQRYVPPTGASLWRDVQQRIATAERRRQQRPTQLWGGLGAAVAALLIGALFAYALHSHVGTTSRPVAASPTTLAPISLQWRQAKAPPGIDNFASYTLPVIAFTSRDSKTAYTCFPGGTNGAAPQVWATHNSATTNWQQLTPPPGTGALDGCILVADSNDANIITATVGAPIIKSSQTTSSFSLDGGQQWQLLSGWTYGQPQQSATVQNVTYLLGGNRLGITHDNWHTWKLIDGPITSAHEFVVQFWTDPVTGAILALGQNNQNQANATTGDLWQTNSGGAHWTKLAPTPIFHYDVTFAQPPTARHPWQICSQHHDDTAGNTHPYTLECSLDGGQSWQARAPLEHAGNNLDSANTLLIGFTHVGTLIDATVTPTGFALYQLATGATTWQSIGAVPGTNVAVTLVDDGSHAVLWAATKSPPIQFFTVTYV